MTKTEANQVLAILKAAYPNSYRNMTKEEAIGTINVWATQFINIPVEVVLVAVNKLISTNTFPPSIGEVKAKIRSLYWEAWQMLEDHRKATEGIKLTDDPDEEPLRYGKALSPEALATVKEIMRVTEPMRTQLKVEPSLTELLGGYEEKYLGNGQKQLKG